MISEKLNKKDKTLIVVVGPTAIGKTNLAIEVALKLKTEIISADSRQFYKEMSIGTAKPSYDDLQNVEHHFINNISVNEEYNVGKYEVEALAKIKELHQKNDHIVMVGGSGLFIKAVCEGLDEMPEINMELRKELNQRLELDGLTSLLGELEQRDPEYFSKVDKSNPQRIIRALEVCLTTNQPYSSFRVNSPVERNFQIIKIGLNINRASLYERINLRVDQMIVGGLLDEVKSLASFQHLNALQTVGYTELFDFINDKCSLETAIELIKRNTRRYAKRQLTWFNKDEGIVWFSPDAVNNIMDHIKKSILKNA